MITRMTSTASCTRLPGTMPSRYSEIHLPFSFVFPHRRSQRQWNSLWFEEESLDPANSLTCTTRRKRETKLKICLLCWRKSRYPWHSSTIHSCNRHCILRWMPWAVAPFGVPISEYESKTCMPIFSSSIRIAAIDSDSPLWPTSGEESRWICSRRWLTATWTAFLSK